MLGDNIKQLMKANGYTQKELAIRSGCTESAISRYANDKSVPTVEALRALAIALGVTVDELMACKECGRCIHYPVCEAFVSPGESFPEVEGGCGCFKDKDDYEPSGTAIERCSASFKLFLEEGQARGAQLMREHDEEVVRSFAKWLIARPGNSIYCGDLPDLVLEYIEGGME